MPPKKVALKKVVPKGDDQPHLRKVQDNMQTALDQMAVNAGFGMVPIGAVIWVDVDLPGVPKPGENFQLCDGQKITDVRSPMRNQLTRPMTGNKAFLRAGTPTGVLQAADTLVPAHAHAMAAHVHDLNAHTHGPGTFAAAAHTHNINNVNSSGSFAGISVSNPGTGGTNFTTQSTGPLAVTGVSAAAVGNTLGPNPANTSSDGGSGAETRPINFSMAPYLRIW